MISVFGSSRLSAGSEGYTLAENWGRRIAQAGFGVATGGYGGAMKAVSKGARAGGGMVVGVTAPVLFGHRAGPNGFVDLELSSPTLLSRIERLLDLASAFVVLPGGVGTLTELTVAWNLAYIQVLKGKPRRMIGVHANWTALLRPALEIRPEELELLTVLHDGTDLSNFLNTVHL